MKGAGAQICFSGCDDEGWYFVNGQFVGESHDWQAQPIFDIKKFLHAGDNVIAVGVNNGVGTGRFESERDRENHRAHQRRAVVAQPVQRPGANHRAIHAGCRRNQIDRHRRWPCTGDGNRANAALRAAPIRAVSSAE